MLDIGSACERTLLMGTYTWLAMSLEMDDHIPECQGTSSDPIIIEDSLVLTGL